jgi:hypothetical protein
MSLQISSARYFFNDGYPSLEIIVNGKRVWLDGDNRNSLSEDGYIYLGTDFENDHSTPDINIPAKPEIGRGEMQLRGFTADRRIQSLFLQYVRDVDNKVFSERQITLGDIKHSLN